MTVNAARATWFAIGALGSIAVFGSTESESETIEEIIVRADASIISTRNDVSSFETVDAATIQLTRANHPQEIFTRVPGVWISRGSGQEHLTAIRSGVLTGPGACGGYLVMENGISVRPHGFCNVNGLFEVNTEQAHALEVIRGPASGLFGSNALHGVINSVSLTKHSGVGYSLEAGPHGYVQARLTSGTASWQLGLLGTQTAGYRDATGFDQHKTSANSTVQLASWTVENTLAVSNLNQETGGYVRGFEAYRDSSLRTSNPNPEAYRDAWALRLASHWYRETSQGSINVVPYVRRSAMRFLQHFLPGQPTESNSQTSAGVLARYILDGTRIRRSLGANVEILSGELAERQAHPTTGSAFLVATRPAGTHYDYSVSSIMTAAFYDLSWLVSSRTELLHNLRLERLTYDYSNHHLVGNTRDDGTECGFGGCLYTRPADREDSFTNIAGRIGVEHALGDSARVRAIVGRGFRPPQATELYRLQSGQTTADLDSEQLDSFEVGLTGQVQGVRLDLALFHERTQNLIFRDSTGANVSDGKTRGLGAEFSIQAPLSDHQSISLVGTRANHEYEFTRRASRGEQIVSGNQVDTAPRWIASAFWHADFVSSLETEVEVSHIGSHFVDAANSAQYSGHTLVHFRGSWNAGNRISLFGRVLNLLDVEYAERGDYAFGSYRYFPGMPRQIYVGLEVSSP